MTPDEQREFERSVLEQYYVLRAENDVRQVRAALAEGLGAEKLYGELKDEFIVTIDEEGIEPSAFCTPERGELYDGEFDEMLAKWNLMRNLTSYEHLMLDGIDSESALRRLQARIGEIGLLDRVRLQTGLYESLSNSINEREE